MPRYVIRLAVYGVLTACVAVSLYFAVPLLGSADLRVALFAEAIGAFITIGVIDGLLRVESWQRTRPARFAAFRESSLVYARARALWSSMVNSAFDPTRHGGLVTGATTILDLSLGNIVAELNLDANAPVVPHRSWRSHLHQQVTELERQIGSCLQRYAAYMDPQMIVALQDLERSGFIAFAKILPTMPQLGAEMGIRYSSQFTFGANNTANDFVTPLKVLSNLLERDAPKFRYLLPKGSPTRFDRDEELAALRTRIPR